MYRVIIVYKNIDILKNITIIYFTEVRNIFYENIKLFNLFSLKEIFGSDTVFMSCCYCNLK